MRRQSQTAATAPRAILTDDEVQILNLLADGHDRPAIAQHLRVSIRTVLDRRSSVRVKLSARSDPHAVAIAFRLGILAADRRAGADT